jgi:hypothetical protein
MRDAILAKFPVFRDTLKLTCKIILLGVLLTAFSACSRYDYDKADSKANRKGFEYHLGIVPDKNITGVYFFADEWGNDTAYWFAFSAPQEVIDKIILK